MSRHRGHSPVASRCAALLAAATALLAACASPPPRPVPVDPDAVRAQIRGLMPATVSLRPLYDPKGERTRM